MLGRVAGMALLATLVVWVAVGAAAEPLVHRVRWGETLSGIAAQYGVTIQQLVSYNGLSDPNRIYAGQELIIHSGEEIVIEVSGGSRSLRGRSFEWPLPNGILTSHFGLRDGRQHNGIDLAAPLGTPILAAAPGRVIYADWAGTYGMLVMIDHGDGIITRYAHCSALWVTVGDRVAAKEPIAAVGSTGRSTGPHLHFEIEVDSVRLNPLILLPERR